MNKKFNSASEIFDELIRLTNNSLLQQQATTKSIISTNDSVTVQLENSNGEIDTYSIPTWGNITSRMSSMEQILSILTDGTDIKASFRMPDGSFKRIIEYKSDLEPVSFDTFTVPKQFKQKNNWFFETLLNPSLMISLDIPLDYDDISEINKVFNKRVIILPEGDAQELVWINELKNKNDLDFDETIDLLNVNGISYFIDDNIMDLPLNILKYNGTFDILGIRTVTNENDPTILQRKYRLNKLTYSDNLLNETDTIELKVGDVLLFGDNTEYKVSEVDITTNEIVLVLIHGNEGIKIGMNLLKIKSDKSNIRTIDILIANDEKQIIFVKPINKDIHIASTNWSKGISFDSNELEITTNDGIQTLDVFYNNSVFDLGKQFLNQAKEKTIPAILGLIPNAPVLSQDSFQVVQINSHATDSTESDNVKTKYADKVSINSEITELNKTIEFKKQVLNNNVFTSDSERNTAKNEFNALIQEKSIKITQYSSILSELTSLTKDNSSFLIKPKYRLRTFFPIPESKIHVKTGKQEIIQFEVQYRYLRKDGNNTGIKTIPYLDSDSTQINANFSDWKTIKSDIRKKIFDVDKGYYVWDDINVEDGDLVNINQIDIPFSKNEKVEIRVRSISEAGYPINPKTSVWSNSIIQEFPDSLSVGNNTDYIISEAESENTRIKLIQELNSNGLDLLLSQAFTNNDKTYFLNSDVISSGLFDSNGIIISLFSKIQEYENRLSGLENKLDSITNVLNVYLIDETGNKTEIANNQTINLNAGYYSEILTNTTNPALSDSQAGKIVTVQWSLVLENNGASVIELASLFPGAFESDLDINQNEFDYQKRLYHDVPINISGLDEFDIISPEVGNILKTKNDSKKQISNFQTKQVKSQFINVRKTNVSLTENLYLDTQNNEEFWFEPSIPTSLIPNANIWNGTFTNGIANGGGDITDFCIHKDHPLLNDLTLQNLPSINDRIAYLLRPLDTTLTGNQASGYAKMRHSKYFNLNSNVLNGTKQLIYKQSDTNYNHIDSMGNLNGTNGYMYSPKQGFIDNDEYLIGANTCGSYLYFSTDRLDETFVNGTDSLAVKNIKSTGSLSFKIVFQFRATDKLGSIAGQNPSPLNVSYRKKIGLDIKTKNQTLFSFDLDVTSKFKRDNLVS